MSKRCELQKKYYKEFGNYKGVGKYSDHYVNWLESRILALTIPVVMECKHDFEPYYNWCSELAGYRCEKCGEEKD
jgi:hypothetical protein